MHHNRSDDGSNVFPAQQNSQQQQQQQQQRHHNELFRRSGDTSTSAGDISHTSPRTQYMASSHSSQGAAWMEGRRHFGTPSRMVSSLVSARGPFSRTVVTVGRHSSPESQRNHHHFQRGYGSHHIRGRNDVRVPAPSSSSIRMHSMLPERRSGSHDPSQQRRHHQHHHHNYCYYQYYQQLEQTCPSQGHQLHHSLLFASSSSLRSAAVHSPVTMPLLHATTHGNSGESSHLFIRRQNSNISRASLRQHMIIPSSHGLLRHPQREEPPLVCVGGPVPMGRHANVNNSHNDRHPPLGPHCGIHQSQHPHRDQQIQSPQSPSHHRRNSSGNPIMTIHSTVPRAERHYPHASRRVLLKDSPQCEINISRPSDECPFVSSPLMQSSQNDERPAGEHVGYLIPPQAMEVVGLPTCCLDLDDTLVHTFGERPKWWDPSSHPRHFEIEVEMRNEDLATHTIIPDVNYTGGIDAHCFGHHSAVYPPEQQRQTQVEMLHRYEGSSPSSITTRERLYVCLRPYAEALLNICFKHFEVVFFTTGTEEYARQVFDVLDPGRRAHRLYRHHCTRVGARSYMKDLSRLGRPLHRVLLLDDRGPDVSYQRRNVLLCDPFVVEGKDDPYDRVMNDDELLGYARFLETLARLPQERMLEAVQDYQDVMNSQMSAGARMVNDGQGAQAQVIHMPDMI